MIYRNLLSTNIKELYDKYDGFILDEYHRAGARETNKKILELKELIKNGKDEKKLIFFHKIMIIIGSVIKEITVFIKMQSDVNS